MWNVRIFTGSALLLATIVLWASPVSAQTGFYVGFNGGVSLPLGDLNDDLDRGFTAGITIGLRDAPTDRAFAVEVQWHRFDYLLGNADGLDTGSRLNAIGGMGRFDIGIAGGLYATGGGGLYRQEVTVNGDLPDFGETTDINFAVQAGLGLNLGESFHIEGRWIKIFTEGFQSTMIPITVGIRF